MWNIQHFNSAMAGSRKLCKNKNYFNLNSINGLVLIVYTMALMFLTHGINTLETESNEIRCSDSMTCTKCTIKPMCVWSLQLQSCKNKTKIIASGLVVFTIEKCPRFSVDTKYQYNDKTNIYVSNTLKITNDLIGFMNYLNSCKIYMALPNYNFQVQADIISKTDISYSFIVPKSFFIKQPIRTFFTIIKFNDIILRYDDVADHYISVYEHKECATDENNKSCVTCGWNKDGYSNYLKWCSSEKTCKVRKNLYMKSNATNELDENVVYVTNDCAEINVTSVDPLSGPKTGGTNITIIVKNHMIFMENRTLKVTVAGTICMNPKTSGLENITCTMSQSAGTLFGPVLVEYSSIESVLKIESSQVFQFCHNPVLDTDQQLGGVESGGTSVPVHGSHFVEPCVVSSTRLYVDLPDGVRWYADSYCDPPVNDTYMVCQTPSLKNARWDIHQSVVGHLLNFGLMVTTFTKNQSMEYINGTSLSFYVYPDPVLENFVIDEAGSVFINGFNLEYVRMDDIVIRYLNTSSTGFKVVSVKSKRIECDPTMTFAPVELQEILVEIGDSLKYTLANRSPTPIAPIVDPFIVPFPEHPSIFQHLNKINCSDSMTCTKCTIKSMCIWSLQLQECKNNTHFNSSGLIVKRVDKCPRFSVVKEYYNGESSVSLKYIVKVSNDSVGFNNYLNDSIILYNRFPTYCKHPTRQISTYNETIISCEFYVKKSYFDYNNPSFTFFTFINFNDVMLRFDNVADHYVTFYEKEDCANDEKYKSCAICAWNNDGYSNYLRWCLSDNACQVNKNLYMMNNGKEQLNAKIAHLTNNCAEINVTAVDPLAGPETGGTTITITVRNHRILADNRTVMVTIAGRECMNPRTSGLETLTCTTSQSVGTLSGSILVEYSSTESVLKIESPQIFHFCLNPVLDADQQLGGIVSGGTSVPVRGKHFIEPCFAFLARLYVDLAEGVRLYSDSYCDSPVNDTYMVCRSPRMNSAHWDGSQSVVGRLHNFGIDVMKFTGNQSFHVNGTSLSFYVHPDAVLEDFVIDEAGSVIINGLNLDHVRLDNIVVRFLNSSNTDCKVVSIKSNRIICDPTMVIDPVELHEILVEIGDSLKYTLANRSPTPIAPKVDPFIVPFLEHPSIFQHLNKTNCSDSMTCTKCTIKTMCIWSLQLQKCKNSAHLNTSGLIVIREDECPRFSVVKEYNYGESSVSLKYIVNLSNDLVGFRNFFKGSKLYSRFPTYCKHPTRQVSAYNETIISCEFYVKKSYFDYNNPSFTFFTFINFNDVMLRFDNVADHYITFYEKEDCANDEKYKSCAICAWNNDGYSNYLRWCLSDNACQVNKNLYMMNNGKEPLNAKIAHLTNNCAEINVTAVDPLAGPETGGTTITITVRNHRILADNRTVMVTIAGRECMNPRTSGLETLTCTTSQSVGTLSGSILVEYSSTESVLKIESPQIFHFCLNPVLDADQQLGGIVSGGTSVPVRGKHFIEPCFAFLARLYVDLAEGVRRYSDSYCDSPVNDTYMVCQSPRVNGTGWDGDTSVSGRLLDFGLEVTFSKGDISLNQSRPIMVRGPLLRFYIYPDPVLFDFKIDEIDLVVVNGLHLQHVQPEDIVISTMDSPSSVCVVVSVTPHSLVCEATMHVTELQLIYVKLGNALLFTVVRRPLLHPEDPFKLSGWFLAIIAMSTALVFVFVLYCCRRTIHRVTVTETNRNLPKVPTKSQDLYEQTEL